MAKKTPVKKSRRRLKRSVRRSLAAVLMITAIGVAAIPVPENYAVGEDGISTYAIETDPHVMSGFGYADSSTLTPSVDETVDTGTINAGTISLKEHIKSNGEYMSLDELLANESKYHASLATTDIGGGSYDLSWQFLYYETKEPDSGSQRNVICKYNNQYSTDELELKMNPVTKYYEVSLADYEAYYDAGAGASPSAAHTTVMGHMDFDPTVEIEYDYDDYKDETSMDQSQLKFLQDYCGGTNGLYTQKREAFAQYEAALAKYEAELEAWDGEGVKPTEPDKPGALIVTPSDLDATIFSTEQRLKFFCDHDKNLVGASGYGRDYTLVRVGDSRPLKTGETSASALYLARGGTPIKENGGDNDKYGFLTIGRSDYPICAIGNGAFKGVSKVVNMTIPSMIGYIGDEAFADATLLESIQIDNVAKIGNRAFQGCVRLSNVKIAQGTETIGADCFSGTAIQTIELPTSMRTIGYGAFSNCKNLTSINLNGMSTACVVKDYAFYNCTALDSIQMGESNITYLGKGAFAVDGSSLSMGIVLPQKMESTVTINGVSANSIGDYLFAGRTNLQYVVFPPNYGRSEATATKIPDAMFHGCSYLQYVEFPTTDSDQTACGYLSYDPKQLFADVANEDFFVKGPKVNSSGRGSVAVPRETTWDAETAVSDTVPYMYVENGMEYYEVSDGFYLLCVDDEGNKTGKLTSCTFKPNLDDAKKENWEKTGGKLTIPATVGNTTVTGIANNCFTDSSLNQKVKELIIEDNSISTIASGAFQGGGGTDKNDWQALETVYIGNSVTDIGANAFKDCISLVDVTFASPLGGHEAFTIGTDAFKTQSPKLTFHGDIVVGYDPFEWAMDPDNIINKDEGLRICYKSLSPSYLTVMYNPITKMVTLLDYPKYAEIDTLLNTEHEEEIKTAGFDSYHEWRENIMYNIYRDSTYDSYRKDFAVAWQSAGGDEDAQKELYNSGTYGPWVTPEFCDPKSTNYYWKNYLTSGTVTGNETDGQDSVWQTVGDWLFEPIIAYAAADVDPTPYYTKNPYIVTKATEAGSEFYRTTPEEEQLVFNTKNIVVPEGVQSIDVWGYVNNLTEDGEKYTSGSERNTANVGTYLRASTGWDTDSRKMYENEGTDADDEVDIIPGLFSGSYTDGDAAPRGEKRERGNDVIYSVTLNNVKYLPDYAFDSCENLASVELGPDLANIGKAPFRGCYNLQAVGGNDYYFEDECIIYSYNTDGSLTIEECLAGRGNIRGNGTVNSLFDPNILKVSAIKPGAFEDCDYLSEVDFGSNNTAGLTEIPEDCFRNCNLLSKVTLPMTVNDVGPNSFVGANSLNSLVVYGKEVKISGRAFRNNKKEDGSQERTRTTVRTYADSAVVRYVKEYGTEYNLYLDEVNPLGEVWEVSFYDQNYQLIEDLKDREGNALDNPQYVEDGGRPTEPQNPPNTDDWTFERWVGTNNVNLGDTIHGDVSFYARGYSSSGLVNGKYLVTFIDGVDYTQVGPVQPIEPGSDAFPPAHPTHAGFEPDGYSDDYTNIQSPKTIILKYKVIKTSGGGSGTNPTGSGNSSNTPNQTGSNGSSSTTSNSGTSTAQYTVTVENGSGSGTYNVGATVIIAANSPPTGMVFQKWTTESNGVSFASVSMSATTFVMPANNVTVKANYVAGSGATGSTGSGTTRPVSTTGTTGNNGTRVDITKPGISNKDLATAKVNGSTDNFVVKISETDEATRAVADALAIKYGNLENILYYAMDISLYDSTGTTKISNTTGLTVDITIPIPDALVAFGGNNMAGAVINSNQLEELNESFTTINGVPCIKFTATHFSPYTIYVDTSNLSEGLLDISPKTGDPIHPKWFLSIGLACLSIILFMKKDKKVKLKTA